MTTPTISEVRIPDGFIALPAADGGLGYVRVRGIMALKLGGSGTMIAVAGGPIEVTTTMALSDVLALIDRVQLEGNVQP